MRIMIALIAATVLQACASTTNLQRDCKEIGGGYWECEKYPWALRSCERFK